MSCSKFLPPFAYELLCFFNREQLERLAIICRPLKNLINRYFQSKPCRIFNVLEIRGGSYRLHNDVQWHPNRDDYSVQQFLAGEECTIYDAAKISYNDLPYYSFAEMHPYLGPTIRIKVTIITVGGESVSEHIAEMESIAYLWRDHYIIIGHYDNSRIVTEDFQSILQSPTILQCRKLNITNRQIPFKDYEVLYTVKVLEIDYLEDYDIDPNCWSDFLEKPGLKPVVALRYLRLEHIDNFLKRLKKAFSSAAVPNAFKIVFPRNEEPLIEFCETNNSGEKLEFKKGLPVECQEPYLEDYDNYTLERSSI